MVALDDGLGVVAQRSPAGVEGGPGFAVGVLGDPLLDGGEIRLQSGLGDGGLGCRSVAAVASLMAGAKSGIARSCSCRAAGDGANAVQRYLLLVALGKRTDAKELSRGRR